MKTRGYSKAPYKLGSFFRRYFTDLEKELGKEITVIWGGCQTRFRDKDEEGIIFFDYATPQVPGLDPITYRMEEAYKIPGTEIFMDTIGLQKLREDRRYNSSGDEGPFGLFTMYNYDKDTVWLLIPLATYSTREALDRHVKAALTKCTDYKALGAEKAAKTRKVNEGLKRILRNRLQRQITEATTLRNDAVAQLRAIEREAARLETQRLDNSKRAAELTARSTITDEEIAGQIAHLKSHKYLEEIEITRDVIKMYLHPMYLHSADHKERTYLGRIEIRINLTTNALSLHNLDNTRGGHAHPHCSGTNPCWGNMSAAIGRMLAQHNLIALLDTMVSYLENYNITDDQAVIYAREWWSVQEIEYLNPHTKKYESLEEKDAREKQEREEASKKPERIDPLEEAPARQPRRGERLVINA